MSAAEFLSNDALAESLKKLGFQQTHRTQKVLQFSRGQLVVYTKRNTHKQALVIHPHYMNFADDLRSVGEIDIETPVRSYINSNLGAFPIYSATHRETDSRHGLAVGVSQRRIKELIDLLDKNSKIITPEGEVRAVSSEAEPLTERERLQAARVGQGDFRTALMSYWHEACPVTQIDHPALLRASHIKSWAESMNNERLNPYNGILLAAHIDALFDRHLISFEDDGLLLISSLVSADNRARLGLTTGCRISGLRPEHSPFLKHHRGNFRP